MSDVRERRDSDLVDIREVAATLAVCARTVYRLVHAGKLPAPVRSGKGSRWRWRDVRRYVESLRPGLLPVPAAPKESRAG